jgi:hypothetical protein
MSHTRGVRRVTRARILATSAFGLRRAVALAEEAWIAISQAINNNALPLVTFVHSNQAEVTWLLGRPVLESHC